MQGRISSWIKFVLGLDPENLYPSVRCGLEGALLTALAQAHCIPLAKLLHRQDAPLPAISADTAHPPEAVLVNGLLDCCGTVEACTEEALDMVAQGYSALKIKVCCLMCWSCSAALKQTSLFSILQASHACRQSTLSQHIVMSTAHVALACGSSNNKCGVVRLPACCISMCLKRSCASCL